MWYLQWYLFYGHFFFCKFMSCIELSLKGRIKVANIIIVFKHAANAMIPTEQMNSTLALQCYAQVSVMRTLSSLSSTEIT